MSLASDLRTLHMVEKEALLQAVRQESPELIALFRGRIQGIERAMTLIGIDYIPASREIQR